MTATSGTVLLLHAKNLLARRLQGELIRAGLDVVTVTEARNLLEAARGRAVAALLLPGPVVGWGLWRQWSSDAEVRDVPVVVYANRRPRDPSIPWPLGSLVRADAYVTARDLDRPGAVGEVVRALRRRVPAGSPRTRVERWGEALWYVGSGLSDLGLALSVVCGLSGS